MPRQPQSTGAFMLLGTWRGAIAGASFGTLLGLVIAFWPGDDLSTGEVGGLLLYAAVVGVVLGVVVGAIVGAFAGLLRDWFDALWPFAAITTAALTGAIGLVFVLANAHGSHDVAVGCFWALVIAVVLGATAALASIGVTGSRVPRTRESRNPPIG